MEDTSYIKLFRKILKSPIWDNEKALKIWLWCLLKATHIERTQLVGQRKVNLEKGQLIFGRKKASEELNMTESTIYKYIKLLEELQMIDIESNTKFSIITIKKWEEYQIEELKQNSNNKITGCNLTNTINTEEIETAKITAKEQQSNTNKNVKNIYFNLFNKYKEQLSQVRFSQRIKLINELKNTLEYNELPLQEQDNLYNALMSI